jgi:hypothetical protein
MNLAFERAPPLQAALLEMFAMVALIGHDQDKASLIPSDVVED